MGGSGNPAKNLQIINVLDNKAFDIELIRYRNEAKTFKNVQILIGSRKETFTEAKHILLIKL